MPSKPKPTKKERVAAKQDKKSDLANYRRVQSALAIDRDGGLCIFCYFLLGEKTKRDDLHHVYGRGKAAGDWRESYKNLAGTCRRHHPLPIQTPGGNPNLDWVEDVLRMANETPINKKFKHL
jgi:hypothetical protein